jgi:hypothetical protein
MLVLMQECIAYLSQEPLRNRVGGEASVVDRERGLELRVREILVE